MDLNNLLHQHQLALMGGTRAASGEARRAAASRAASLSERIGELRSGLGRAGAFTWAANDDGEVACA